MLIKEMDFSNNNGNKNEKMIPVFMQYENECYEIANNKKGIDSAWPITIKIYYYLFYASHKEYIDSLLDNKISNKSSIIAFSKSDLTFYKSQYFRNDTITKFGEQTYVGVFKSDYNNYLVLYKTITDTKLKNFKVYYCNPEDITNPNFKKEYESLKKQYTTKKKKYQIKKGKYVVGHINAQVLTEEEKLIKYVREEYKKRNLLGDIILSSEQEKTLNEYMSVQLKRFQNYGSSFSPNYSRVFALGLVRYAMKHYNTRGTADFWPYFKEDYNIEILGNSQKYIHEVFEKAMKENGLAYSNTIPQKIDNITMHSFVADHSANQLFDYLFDFWRLDLGRNSDNLNVIEKGYSAFDTLIEAMTHGAQNVMTHTSLLLTFPKTKSSFKNRVKRIIRIMTDAFWNDVEVNETGNRINHLLNLWMKNPKGAFQKEKNYVAKHTNKEKGEILFHSPTFNINYKENKLSILLPHQRLNECIEEDRPYWIIRCSSNEFLEKTIETGQHYKHDRIGCYIEKMSIPIPLHLLLNSFEFSLMNNGKEIKKYKISSSKIRFFDEKGKYIEHNTALVPVGYVIAFSDNQSYPEILGESTSSLDLDGLVMKSFQLVKGQIITLEDQSGVQVGQRLVEGLNESYPVFGATLENEGNNYLIYSKLPKLLFKCDEDDLKGMSLVVNGKHNRVVEHHVCAFKIAKELKTSGYLVDLGDYITNEGLYQIQLSYPKMHKVTDVGSLSYIKDFNYEFWDAPYIFKEDCTIAFKKPVHMDQNTNEKDGIWASNPMIATFQFNYGERNPNSDNFCSLVKDNYLTLNCYIGNNKYPVHFEIPALYWKFNTDVEWNTKQPANINLKEFKNHIKKLFIRGPFNFNKSYISTTNDVDIAEEESEIHLVSGKDYYEIEKVYYWFKNNRSELYRKIFITIDNQKKEFFNVVCKSNLIDVNIIGDFENNHLEGILEIEGNEEYTVTIYHNGEYICEDEPVVNNHFFVDAQLETGEYQIYVSEMVEEDEDGFDVEAESILLNQEPIIKKLIDINDLEHQDIIIKGYQDINKKYVPVKFSSYYVITHLIKYDYAQVVESGAEIYGIWNQEIDPNDEKQMSQFIYYKGTIQIVSLSDRRKKALMDVVLVFTDKMKPESMIALTKDPDGVDYGSIFINNKNYSIVSNDSYNRKTKTEKRDCIFFFDDQYYYLIDFKERTI